MTGVSVLAAIAMMVSGADGAWPDLSQPGAAVGGGERDAAVIVAVEDYPFLPSVVGAVEVGKAWLYYFDRGRKVPFVVTLFNRDATRLKMLKAVEEAAREVKKGGRLWVVFVGHGAASKDGKDGVLVGVTAQDNEIDFFPHTVGRSEVLALATQSKGEAPVVIIDACFSGKDEKGQSLLTGSQMVVNEAMLKVERASLLTAGRSSDIAGRLPGGTVPAFSYLVLGALMGWGDENGDGKVTSQEAVDYARRTIVRLESGRMQEPQLSGEDLALATLTAAQKAPEPDIGAIQMALSGGSNALRGRLEDLARIRAEREKLEALEAKIAQEQAEELARERRSHEAEVSKVWAEVLAVAGGGGQEGLEAVQMFLNHYANHKHGNPKEADARATLKKIHDQMEQAKAEALRLEAQRQARAAEDKRYAELLAMQRAQEDQRKAEERARALADAKSKAAREAEKRAGKEAAPALETGISGRLDSSGLSKPRDWMGLSLGVSDGFLMTNSATYRTNVEVQAALQHHWGWFQWRIVELGMAVESPISGFAGSAVGVSAWDLFVRGGAEFFTGTDSFVDLRLKAAAGYTAWLSPHWQLELETNTRYSIKGLTTYGFGASIGYVF